MTLCYNKSFDGNFLSDDVDVAMTFLPKQDLACWFLTAVVVVVEQARWGFEIGETERRTFGYCEILNGWGGLRGWMD